MKIAFMITSLQYGGAEKIVLDLIGRFRGLAIECWLIAIYESRDRVKRDRLAETLELQGIRLVELNKRPGEGTFRSMARLKRVLRDIAPDIVNAHGPVPNMYAGIANLWGRKVPTMTTVHNGTDDWPDWKSRTLERLSLLGVTKVVCVAQHVAEAYRSKYPRSASKTAIIENGIDPQRYAPSSPAERAKWREALGCPADTALLIHVGRMVPLKNQHFLVEVAERLRSRGAKFMLLLVGNFEDVRYVREVRRLTEEHGLAEQVRLLGPRENVGDLLGAADVFLFPSEVEAFGLALLEAMCCGLPAVCSDIPSNRKLSEAGARNRILARNAELWAEQIEQLIEARSDRRRQGPNPYWTLERMAGDYLKLYGQSGRRLPALGGGTG
ncbi:glycosyltransferase [Cohnella cellulosilytica]|uniref:Glycosyltransferase n=1 Tax=Cohnella cellulosilytica TaxID=986710 RepID=A0ABW2FK40_9BACL